MPDYMQVQGMRLIMGMQPAWCIFEVGTSASICEVLWHQRLARQHVSADAPC